MFPLLKEGNKERLEECAEQIKEVEASKEVNEENERLRGRLAVLEQHLGLDDGKQSSPISPAGMGGQQVHSSPANMGQMMPYPSMPWGYGFQRQGGPPQQPPNNRWAHLHPFSHWMTVVTFPVATS